MSRSALLIATLVFGGTLTPALIGAPQNATPTRVPASTRAAVPDSAFLQQYCLTCHNARAKSGGLVLEGLDPANPSGHAEVWEKVVRKLRTGMMPPDGAPKPTDAVRETFSASVESSLDREWPAREPQCSHGWSHFSVSSQTT